jgi:hypothetical protein
VRVQLADGREGWVGANYLSTEAPAVVRLKQLQASGSTAERAPPKQLTDEIARLKQQNGSLQTEIAELKKKLQAAQAQPPKDVAPAPAVHDEPEPVTSAAIEPTVTIERSYSGLWLLAVAAAAACGFAAGYQTLGNRVRARFFGVKVY